MASVSLAGSGTPAERPVGQRAGQLPPRVIVSGGGQLPQLINVIVLGQLIGPPPARRIIGPSGRPGISHALAFGCFRPPDGHRARAQRPPQQHRLSGITLLTAGALSQQLCRREYRRTGQKLEVQRVAGPGIHQAYPCGPSTSTEAASAHLHQLSAGLRGLRPTGGRRRWSSGR